MANQIYVSPLERVCLNCGQYQQLFREEPVPGESFKRAIPVSFGFCIQLGRQRGPLCRTCRSYTGKENSRP